MHRLQVKDCETAKREIQQAIRASREGRYCHRLHGVLLVASGLGCGEVARLLGCGRRTVQYWVRQYNERGLPGLLEDDRPGRPPKLGRETLARLEADLQREPAAFGYDRRTWDSNLVCWHLKRHYDVNLGPRQCQRLVQYDGKDQS
ncbi:MAG: helix-turn-helix domain-containing protein [Candidatus Hydrogenedentota bacterium]